MKDLTEEKKRMNDKILDLNVDMQRIRMQKYEENEATKLEKMRQLAQLDLDIRDKMRLKRRSSGSRLLMRISSSEGSGNAPPN